MVRKTPTNGPQLLNVRGKLLICCMGVTCLRSTPIAVDMPEEIELQQCEDNTAQSEHSDLSSLSCKAETTWFRENICKKKCVYFSKGAGEETCKCGYLKDDHEPEAISGHLYTGEPWKIEEHVQEFPTDAFGDIRFGGSSQKPSKYARVSADTDPEVLFQLLTEQWNLPPPKLLISVAGGAKNLSLRPSLKNMFHRGLMKVTQTTGAWIISRATHAGVMKQVSQAVKDYTLGNNKVVTIGMATWGIIDNREALVDTKGLFPAHYTIDADNKGPLSCLDNTHTHFLLVDDGTHGSYGGTIELRSRLVKCISEKPLDNTGNSSTIPVVCLIFHGEPHTLNSIYNAMLNDTPCVILGGSGRIADVIAHVAHMHLSKVTMSLIRKLMIKFFPKESQDFSEQQIIEWTKKIQDIMRMSHLLTVLRVSEKNQGEMDAAILHALFKASRYNEPQGAEVWKRQLELAIAWNQVDIAKNEIFTEENQWTSSDLHSAMVSALVGNKPEFVKLLLENGLSLRDFLENEGTLSKLYWQMPNCFFRTKLAKRVPSAAKEIPLGQVYAVLCRLLGTHSELLYPSSLSRSQSGTRLLVEEDTPAPWHPARDLFLWAVVQSNKELAEIAWEQCRDCICAALAASKILKEMSRGGSDADEAEDMRLLARHYEQHAIGVFTQCYSCDQERAKKLLVRVSPFWGKMTCLHLALRAGDKNFVALSGVQAHLTQIWCGELSVDNPVCAVFICMIFFPLIYTGCLKYRSDEKIQRESRKEKEQQIMTHMTGSTDTRKSHDLKPAETPPLGCWSRLVGLYDSPQVKFYWSVVSHLAFLVLFSVVLMMDFQVTPSPAELVLYVWTVSLLCEEVRELFSYPDGFGFYTVVKMYINDAWNILDILSIAIFFLGLGLRYVSLPPNSQVAFTLDIKCCLGYSSLTTVLFYAGKIILCIDFVVFCLRLMAIFIVSKTLGPKIIIVKKMMRDVFFFMFLLSIWVVAYGVAKQGVLIHNDNRLDWILRGAVYEPYLIIFGNFPTNIDYAGFDMDSCSMNGTDPLKPKCPVLTEDQTPAFPEWLTIIMLCVYLLFANILLLNLLIAIFNFTFQEVQDNTDRIWKFQRYELIKEYHSRPAAPPPFIILSHIYLFIRGVILQNFPKDLKDKLPQEEELLTWEALMRDRYLLSSQQQQRQTVEQRVQDTALRVAAMSERLEQSTAALQSILKTLRSAGFPAKDPQAPPMATWSSQSVNDGPDSAIVHVKARQLHYPNSKMRRFPVPEEKVPWEVSFDLYEPTDGTREESGDVVDRSANELLDKYRNPGGRTGIKGRGALSCLGPNLCTDVVVTRWRDGELSVLEFLGIQDDIRRTLELPGGLVQSPDQLPERLKRSMGIPLYEKVNQRLSTAAKVFEGYVDDSRNTDNAWVESVVLNLHLDWSAVEDVEIMNLIADSNGSLKWKDISSKTGLSSNQSDALRWVAERHNKKC
ncbi:LOW QUALITY PROTEIN: transient receptor potential cation channel subfamily M member 2-like [Synchiropus splendidus]|uniref:LOW QUALITY PROTEIN: transient receptor potential cation channel subfamily M member 2-like n=1 Tax=Synchiropus splendidus TaxID=270530 RepID=UPI00237DA504|nr:LOW QUALITY PROTEIN: transient receptor potential cation channel subfamily M member 2-like [Synchiropus splendidus]